MLSEDDPPPDEQPASKAVPAAEASTDLLRAPEGRRGGGGYGTADVLGKLVRTRGREHHPP
ncbi:hypothetical protein ACYF6T_30725 [Streptomyces sp. 7R007]